MDKPVLVKQVEGLEIWRTVRGSIECMRAKPVEDLQSSLLATGLQFQPITDNITIWKK